MKNEELKVKNTLEKTHFLFYISQFQLLFVLLPDKNEFKAKSGR